MKEDAVSKDQPLVFPVSTSLEAPQHDDPAWWETTSTAPGLGGEEFDDSGYADGDGSPGYGGANDPADPGGPNALGQQDGYPDPYGGSPLGPDPFDGQPLSLTVPVDTPMQITGQVRSLYDAYWMTHTYYGFTESDE